MISWPAAKQMRCVNPSMTTVSPSWTCAAMAACMDITLEGAPSASSVQLIEALVDDPQRRIHVVLVDHERRRQAQRALPGAEQQQPLAEGPHHEVVHQLRRRLASGPILHELDPDHQAQPAHFSDRGVLLLEPSDPSRMP